MDRDKIKKIGTLLTLVGFGMTLEHRLNHGKWYDEDKEICHGKVGLILGSIGLACLLFD